MKVPAAVCAFVVLLLSFASGTHAQTGMGSPGLSGLWQPTVGAGASYEVSKAGQPKQPFEFAVIGTEKVQGRNGVWVEFTIAAEQIGVMVIKELVAVDAAKMQMQTFKAVIQLPGRPPMQLPDEMIQSQQPFNFRDVRAEGVNLGTQSVTTPAGVFACEHYRTKDGASEFWVSKQVTPIGLVKSVQKAGQTVVLVKVVTNAKDKISGIPQPFDPMMFLPQDTQQ